jgi:hypothetical protein
MKRFFAFALLAALGAFTLGCESQQGTTESKTQTTTTQRTDGKKTSETTTTTDTKTRPAPVTPDPSGQPAEPTK